MRRLTTTNYYDEKLIALRAGFAAGLKYYWSSDNPFMPHYLAVLRGGKLPRGFSLKGVAGDIFAFWYKVLQLPADDLVYQTVVADFFETP